MTMSQTRIVWLEARADTNDRAVGHKALGLIRLIRIGLPVPAGFCLTAGAYREHMETHGILGEITSVLRDLGSAPAERKKAALQAIQEAILRAPLAAALRRAVETHYRRLGTAYVAVRSSATAEDLPDQSLAGQYGTYLGITNLDECLAAIQRCWASLWTERAWEYRQQKGLDHLAVGMAVIVQSLVRADASGVLFTADPATGRNDRITIEACWGLGEALVSGRVTPDRFLVRKRDLRLLAKTIGDKRIESVPARQGGIRQQPVAPERAAQASIKRRTVIRLARLAKRAEAWLGGPQDMEWTVHGRTIFFLQSRPITALAPAASWEDRQVWTNANLGEVLPDVMTPITASFTALVNDTLLIPVQTMLGLEEIDRERFLRLIAGRLYFNAGLGLALIQHLPGAQRFDYRALVGGAPAVVSSGESPDLAADVADLRVSTIRMILRIPQSIRRLAAHRQAKGRRAIRRMQQINCRLQDLDLSRLSQEELGRRFTALVQDGVATFHLLYAALATAPLSILYKVSERWLGDTAGALANSLLADAGDMASAQAGIDLWRLAAQAREMPPVRQVLVCESDWSVAKKKLSAFEAGRTFLQGWDRFMACHGHHCRGEIEFYNPRWRETPDYILKLLRGYLAQTATPNPFHDHQEHHRRREQLRRQCLRQLRNPVKREIFVRLLRAARSGSVLRENFKNEGIRWTATLRRMLLEIGARLAGAGVLREPDDVFFLQLKELEAVLHGVRELDTRAIIAMRRAEYEKNKSVTPPPVVMGRFDPRQSPPQAAGESTNVLHGVAASAGVATGSARVILRADTDEQVQAGEILVAPFTDPGWTPYFVPAAGIVTEWGGLLSHGSIIAREYGLPAVVNVPAATRIIRTGQVLQVDGNRGIVTIFA